MGKILAIGVFILSIPIAYYFLFFLPTFQKQEAKISKDQECFRYAEKNYPGYINSEFTSVMQTEYRYNYNLNTCLAYFQMKGDYDSRNVVDLYSTQNILQYYQNCKETQKSLTDGKPEQCLTLTNFMKKKSALFGE